MPELQNHSHRSERILTARYSDEYILAPRRIVLRASDSAPCPACSGQYEVALSPCRTTVKMSKPRASEDWLQCPLSPVTIICRTRQDSLAIRGIRRRKSETKMVSNTRVRAQSRIISLLRARQSAFDGEPESAAQSGPVSTIGRLHLADSGLTDKLSSVLVAILRTRVYVQRLVGDTSSLDRIAALPLSQHSFILPQIVRRLHFNTTDKVLKVSYHIEELIQNVRNGSKANSDGC